MHRFISFGCAVTAATLLVVACGSDSNSGSSSTGGSAGTANGGSSSSGAANGGSGGNSSADKCAAPAYADVAASDFPSKTVAGKACADASDAAGVCANDLAKIGATCGKTCLTQGGSDAVQATCVGTCINQSLSASSAPLGDACIACYTADVACARKMCFGQCALAPTSDACAKCRVDMGCAPTFYDCSGLPIPTGVDLGGAGAGGSP